MSDQSRTKRRKSSRANAVREAITVGVDLGDRKCHICIVDGEGEIVKEEAITTSPAAFKDYFKKLPTPTVVAIEVGPHSRWVSQVISECGHEPTNSLRAAGLAALSAGRAWLGCNGVLGLHGVS